MDTTYLKISVAFLYNCFSYQEAYNVLHFFIQLRFATVNREIIREDCEHLIRTP